MVCLGNICRSPLAEGIMLARAQAAGLDWELDSAGTGDWHAGEPPHNGSIAVAKKQGIHIENQRSRQIKMSDFEYFDYILAMDSTNKSNILALAPHSEAAKKVHLLLDLVAGQENQSVPDPYLDGKFQEVFDLLDQACHHIIQHSKLSK